MATRVPALIQLSDPRVAAQLVFTKLRLVVHFFGQNDILFEKLIKCFGVSLYNFKFRRLLVCLWVLYNLSLNTIERIIPWVIHPAFCVYVSYIWLFLLANVSIFDLWFQFPKCDNFHLDQQNYLYLVCPIYIGRINFTSELIHRHNAIIFYPN